MSQRWFPISTLLVALLLLGLTQAIPRVSVSKPSATLRVAAVEVFPSPPDTLRSSTTVGTPIIRSLPAQVNDTPVSRYVILEGPALSGVAGRSFTWIPKDTDPGTYDVRLRAHHPDAQSDVLVLRIELKP